MTEPQFPVTLTSEAIKRVRKLIEKDGREDVFLRVGVKGGGCSGMEYVLKLDTVSKPIDQEVELDGIRIVCDSKSATFLQGTVLEFTNNLIGGGFKFENPNAGRSCGCGTSFTPKAS
jgi:iron-sulfur cluster assembly protein